MKALAGAVQDVIRRPRMLGAQLGGNLVLLGLVWIWLSTGEGSLALLGSGVAIALLTLAGSAWLHGAGLAAFSSDEPFRQAARRLPRLFAWSLAFAALYFGWEWLGRYGEDVAAWLSSALTLRLRTPVSPQRTAPVWPWLLRIGVFALGAAAMPWAARAAGVRWTRNPAGIAVYWLSCGMLAVAGLALPVCLVNWIPALPGLGLQAASAAVRLGLAYLLAAAAWLTLAALVTRLGSPLETQDSTPGKP